MKYEYTYYQKSILEGVNSNVVEPLSIEERNEYIQQIHGTEPYRYDYNNPKFIQVIESFNFMIILLLNYTYSGMKMVDWIKLYQMKMNIIMQNVF